MFRPASFEGIECPGNFECTEEAVLVDSLWCGTGWLGSLDRASTLARETVRRVSRLALGCSRVNAIVSLRLCTSELLLGGSASPRFASCGVSYKTRGELTSKRLRRPLYPLVHARTPRARMPVSPRDVERRMRCIAAFHARLRSIRSLAGHYGYRRH